MLHKQQELFLRVALGLFSVALPILLASRVKACSKPIKQRLPLFPVLATQLDVQPLINYGLIDDSLVGGLISFRVHTHGSETHFLAFDWWLKTYKIHGHFESDTLLKAKLN